LANIRLIKRRIKGIQSTAKITKAMEMIAASKMRKAQERGLAGRAYSEKITQVISGLSSMSHASSAGHPLLAVRTPIKKVAVIHISPDRGLSGGLVSNINRKGAGLILEQKVPVSVIAVGRRGLDFMRRTRQDVIAEFINLGDKPGLLDTLPISRIVIDDFSQGKVDAVYLVYARFISTAVQIPVAVQLLPVLPPVSSGNLHGDYIYEPGTSEVLNALLPRYVEMQVYHAILEGIASEQSARMIAMRNATDNAEELIGDLTLVYNKARQESITTELLDIIGGAAALT
jgi:F-type H+-transporting ATPase subunit gamma